MASFTDTADWGADVDSDGGKYPDDGNDWVGDDTIEFGRTANKFTISTLPVTDTVTQVDVSVEVLIITHNTGTATWIIGPYHLDGQANPETDAGTDMWARCDVSSDNYLTGITDYRVIGLYSHTDLGAAANSDVEAARDSGTIFSLAWRMTNESLSNNDLAELAEYTHGTNPPKLTITHIEAGASIYPGFKNTNKFRHIIGR